MIRNFSRSRGTYNLLILVKDSSDPRSAGPIIRHFFLRERSAANMGVAQTGSGSDHRTVGSALAPLNGTLASELRNLRLLRNEADSSVDEQDADEMARRVQHSIELAEFIRRELTRLV